MKKGELKNIPLVAMRGVVMFPNTVNHFDVSRDSSIKSINYCLDKGDMIFLTCQKDISVEHPEINDLYSYGIVADVRQVLKINEDLLRVLVDCKYRAKLHSIYTYEGIRFSEVSREDAHRILKKDEKTAAALVRSLQEQLNIFVGFVPKIANDILMKVYSDISPAELVEYLAFNLPLQYQDKQTILSEASSVKRLSLLLDLLVKENDVLKIEQEINEKVQDSMMQNQREFYLREQMRTISEELGEEPQVDQDYNKHHLKIESLPLESTYKEKLHKEVNHLSQQSPSSPEYAVIDQYLETVLNLPWNIYTKDNLDIKRAQRILDKDHYGLTEVKDRIVEYLAVRARTGRQGGQILCLVGPPGVGKTSIAKSLADSMGRKFVRMSLGGVRDEAEIRGHRRTYVAAMPGKIIAAIQQAGSSNPLILLDEIDKLGNDYKGDPSSALLEVLDPEQNNSFVDHYLDIPYDLSNAIFVTTANDGGSIPSALYDRMEVIELSSYTRIEKYNIAKKYLLPKQKRIHGLTSSNIVVPDHIINQLIEGYTDEAGVRGLEKVIAKLCRKVVKTMSLQNRSKINVTKQFLLEQLGAPISHDTAIATVDTIGLVNGLAWTAVGGVTLPIEVVIYPGNGKITLTGSLGDVMKESAQLALTIAKMNAHKYGIDPKVFTENDIHLHAPEGAVKKDGPSAGVTMVTAIVSAACKKAVKCNFSMTGEITLQGKVLPIGGLKEKLIAAYKENISDVIIPKANIPNLRDIPEEVLNSLRIHPVSTIDEVLSLALSKES